MSHIQYYFILEFFKASDSIKQSAQSCLRRTAVLTLKDWAGQTEIPASSMTDKAGILIDNCMSFLFYTISAATSERMA